MSGQMGVWWFCVLFVGCLVSDANRYPKEDMVERLPGQPKVGFRQYSGYVDVDLKNGRSLFYYFAEAEKDPDHTPLTLWLNGGPGCSSVGGGAFTELGPFYPTGDGRGLRRNSMSWNKASNLLFVESPAGVGWSYSNTTSDYNANDDSTGHYVPQLAIAILDHNAHSTGFKFNLKRIAIGNPLLKFDRDAQARYEYLWSHGIISDEIGLAIFKHCDFEDYTAANEHNVTHLCNEAIDEANRVSGDYVNKYDVILDVCYPSIAEQELRLQKMITKISIGVDVCMIYEMNFYFNIPEVQKALHANRTHLPYVWSMCNDFLNYNETDIDTNILPLLKRIIQNRIPVWIFSGDQDSVVPLLSSRTLVRELAHDLHFKVTAPYGAWFHKRQVGGWMTEYGNMLTFATVRGAAHMVPYSQPSRALQLFNSFVRNQRLPNTTHPPIDG